MMGLGRSSKSYRDGLIHEMSYEKLGDTDRWAVIQSRLWLPSQEEMQRLVDIQTDVNRLVMEKLERRAARRSRIRARYMTEVE